MEVKEVKGLMEAYASIYEGYGKKDKKKKMHDCATHVEHSEYGQGLCIKEQHTMLEDGTVTHYDVEFGGGIVENVPITELKILASEAHEHFDNYDKNAEILGENETLQKKVGQALDAAAKNPVVQAIGKVIAPVGRGRGTVTKAEQDAKIKSNEDVDLFDLVKGHLIDEGYADTEEAALVIMANMSEDWKQSILEDVYSGPIKQEKPKPREGGTPLAPGREGNFGSGYERNNKPTTPSRTPPRNPGRAEGGSGRIPDSVTKYGSGG